MNNEAIRPSRDVRRDRNRRRRWHSLVDNLRIKQLCKGHGVTQASVKEVAHGLSDYSDDSAESVYGHQRTYAMKLDCSVKHLQRCIRILEVVGAIKVTRFQPERMSDGKWARRSTNRYHFLVPPGKQRGKKSRSSLSDTPDAYNQHPLDVYKPLEYISCQKWPKIKRDLTPLPAPDVAKTKVAILRESLR